MALTFSAYEVRDLGSVAGLIPATDVRGIYVLHFADDAAYVGQTRHMWKRFAQHRRTYGDITHIEYAPVAPDADLDALEIAEIRHRASRRILRNITHYLPPTTIPSKLDPIVPLRHQLDFQRGEPLPDRTDRLVTEEERSRGLTAYSRFAGHPDADFAVRIAAIYLHTTIPTPRATERRFWAVSAAPSTNAGNRLFCFSVNKPETFVLFDMGDELAAFVNVSRTALADAYGSVEEFAQEHDWIYVQDAPYEACGGDAVALRVWTAADLERLFVDPANSSIVEAARVLNLALMRKGPTLQGRWHNVPLTDTILEQFDSALPDSGGDTDDKQTDAALPTAAEEYDEFHGITTPLPFEPGRGGDVVADLIRVVAVEGPALGSRLERAYAHASGIARVSAAWHKAFTAALARAVRQGDLVSDAPLGERRISDRTYRLADQPDVRVRDLGPREFTQVPPRELAAVLDEARHATGSADLQVIARTAAGRYGITRLGTRVRAHIDAASRLCPGEATSAPRGVSS